MPQNQLNLNTPVEKIGRIGQAYVTKLKRLGIFTVKDIFYHFPHRYDDFSKIMLISEIEENQNCTIIGKIIKSKNAFTFRRRMSLVEIIVADDSDQIKAVWFNQPYLAETLKEGLTVALSGKATFNKTLSFSNPSYEIIRQDFDTKDATQHLIHTGRLVPVYPETAGVTSRWLRYILRPLLPEALKIADYLPAEIIKSQKLMNLPKALIATHFPPNQKTAELAKKRLGFDEIFLIQLLVLLQKQKWHKQKSVSINFNQPLIKDFVTNLPFKLTDAQRRSVWEIIQDMEKTTPMNRLLEGDVGSGKTVVAAVAALQAVKAGHQVAFMAPTEILANQHFETISNALKKYNLNIALLTSGEPKGKKNKEQLFADIRAGHIQVLIGTHSLIQETVKFKNLALAVIDEQHRFGVMQRAALLKQITELLDGLPQTVPHLLSMTATPIPRTLSLTIYGDLDLSLLDEMPPGRQTIKTEIINNAKAREKTYQFIRQTIKDGQQVFVICPRIDISKTDLPSPKDFDALLKDEVKAVKGEYEKLSKKVFPEFKVAMLHGKMPASEKNDIMAQFSAGIIDILVSTTVIEVGIDIPNATIMLIEGAEKFGLAQLHQLRGRIGRGKKQSYCFLFNQSPDQNKRLQAILRAKTGFELAEYDLEIRGPGQFYGSKQWGIPDLAMASLNDVSLIKNARQEAAALLANDQQLKKYPLLVGRLKEFQAILHKE